MAIRLKRLEEWEGFTGIALVREGLKTEALHTEIKTAFKEMLQLARELDDFSKQKTFYGISVHNIEDGITHYSVFQWNKNILIYKNRLSGLKFRLIRIL